MSVDVARRRVARRSDGFRRCCHALGEASARSQQPERKLVAKVAREQASWLAQQSQRTARTQQPRRVATPIALDLDRSDAFLSAASVLSER